MLGITALSRGRCRGDAAGGCRKRGCGTRVGCCQARPAGLGTASAAASPPWRRPRQATRGAIGFTGSDSGSLILHWNGKNWSRQAAPAAKGLDAVAASSAGNAWAVGTIDDESGQTVTDSVLFATTSAKFPPVTDCPAPSSGSRVGNPSGEEALKPSSDVVPARSALHDDRELNRPGTRRGA